MQSDWILETQCVYYQAGTAYLLRSCIKDMPGDTLDCSALRRKRCDSIWQATTVSLQPLSYLPFITHHIAPQARLRQTATSTLWWPAGHICPTYKESFQVRWHNSIPLFLHAAIYLEVSLFRWTSQNALPRVQMIVCNGACSVAHYHLYTVVSRKNAFWLVQRNRDNCCLFQLMHLYTLKHQLTLTFKTLKNCYKPFSEVAPTCFGPFIRPSSGGSCAVLCA